MHLKQNSVENFGGRKAINSMHASTRMESKYQRKQWAESKECSLRPHERVNNDSLQARLAHRRRVR